MKITKNAGNDCGGFKPPKKGKHLDTQMFPECEGTETDRNIVKKTVERRKKKKSFNLKEYKTAEKTSRFTDPDTGTVIGGPDMEKLDISKLDMMKDWLEKKHPNINWTIEAVKEWINHNFIGKPKPFTGPHDVVHNL